MILADEINRTPPKTQAALLEAMQEKQVNGGWQSYALPRLSLFSRDPESIEQEGTYPLPEAQLDRFMFNVLVKYPTQEDELEIVLRTTSDTSQELTTQISGQELLESDACCSSNSYHAAPRSLLYSVGSPNASRL